MGAMGLFAYLLPRGRIRCYYWLVVFVGSIAIPGWMLALCITGATGHWFLIRSYELAEASSLQPFAYFQLIFGALFGILIFNEVLRLNVAVGAAIVICAGLFTFVRARRAA